MNKAIVFLLSLLSLISCNHANDWVVVDEKLNLTESLEFINPVEHSGYYLLELKASTNSNYAYLSLKQSDDVLLDHQSVSLNKPLTSTILVEIKNPNDPLVFIPKAGDVIIHHAKLIKTEFSIPVFQDITESSGLVTSSTWKYGGPSVADIDNDGDYDIILNNHHEVPTQLFWNNGNGTLTEHDTTLRPWDVHGTAAGDYDRDGDLDIIIAQGGGNGTNPQPPHLLRNANGSFKRISDEVGITHGARGRSVRWVDMDMDNDLDLMVINAEGIDPSGGAQHLFYENDKGLFTQVKINDLENTPGERLLITDLNNDLIDDIVLFSPLSIWLGNGEFEYENVTKNWISEDIDKITAVAPIDIENDGDVDLYLSRGKPYYFIANKSLDFDPLTGRLDLRDEGNKAITSMEFVASGEIEISDQFLWYRLYDGGFPFHLGAEKDTFSLKEKQRKPIKPDMAEGWPKKRNENGWYLGYLGNNRWKMEWVRNAPIYWGIRLSISGVTSVYSDFEPQDRNVQDVLLQNEGNRFINVSKEWNVPIGGNHQGVTAGDFNNDGLTDLILYRFGLLNSRVKDWLLVNSGNQFLATHSHNMLSINDNGHGDMGQAFDFDLDGIVDVLSGSDNEGTWHLFKNKEQVNNSLTVKVGYSLKDNVDPISAVVKVYTENIILKRRVESPGAVHSQSLLNIVHFGLRDIGKVDSIMVTWRNGEKQVKAALEANQIIQMGKKQ